MTRVCGFLFSLILVCGGVCKDISEEWRLQNICPGSGRLCARIHEVQARIEQKLVGSKGGSPSHFIVQHNLSVQLFLNNYTS